MRLDRLLGSLGFGSRQQVKALLRQGRVQVDGETVTQPELQVPEGLDLRVDGAGVDSRLSRHVMLHKPTGVLTAARDPKQPTVMDLLPPLYRSLQCMPVGRLDKDTSGLLLFTTDGQAAHRLLSPKREVEKVYRARVQGRLTGQDVRRFAEGIELTDFVTRPAALTILEAGEDFSLADCAVTEGKYHQVRRMFGACGHEVVELSRLRFGPLELDPALSPGDWRELSDEEWRQLLDAAG